MPRLAKANPDDTNVMILVTPFGTKGQKGALSRLLTTKDVNPHSGDNSPMIFATYQDAIDWTIKDEIDNQFFYIRHFEYCCPDYTICRQY